MMKTVLHATTYGDRANPPLALLHGFMGRGDSFSPVIPWLAERFFVVALDLPGHGQSLYSTMPESGRPGSLIQAAEMILRSLDFLGLDSFFLYGYSMGGRVAQQVCLLAPGRIKRLFLESAGFGIRNPEERQARRALDEALFKNVRTSGDFRRFLVRWHRLPLFGSLADSPLLPGLIESKIRNNVEELQQALKVMGVGVHPWFCRDLAELSIPITYLRGEEDAKYAKEAGEAASIIAGMRIVSVPGASHNVHIQFPKEVARAVLETAPQA